MRKDLKDIYEANLRDFGKLKPPQIMALTLWAESRGEPLSGKVAVGTVILNRVKLRDWDGYTVQDVCLWPKQFSCFNPDDRQRPKMVQFAEYFDRWLDIDKRLADCYALADGLLSGIIQPDEELVMAECCQYLNPKLAPATKAKWLSSGMKSIKIVGNHEFFTDVG